MNKKVYTFESFVNDDTFSDVKFLCSDGVVLYGHRLILSQVSDFFSIMFHSGMREGTSETVTLADAKSEYTLVLLKYAYGADVKEMIQNMDVIEALELCRLASQFMMKDLCEYIIFDVIHPRINEKNCAEILNCSSTHSRVGDYEFWNFLQTSALKYALDNLAKLEGLDILGIEAFNKIAAKMSQTALCQIDIIQFCESHFIPWAEHLFGVEGVENVIRVLATCPPFFDEVEAETPNFTKVFDLIDTPNYSMKYVFNDSDGFRWFVDFSNSEIGQEKRACLLIGPDEKLPTKTNHGWVTLAHFWAGVRRTKQQGPPKLKTPLLSRVFTSDYRCQGHGCGAGCSFAHSKICSQCDIQESENFEIQVQISANHLYGLICYYVFNSLSKNMDAASLLPFSHLKEVLQKDTLPVECEKHILDLVLLWAEKHKEDDCTEKRTEILLEELIPLVRYEFIEPKHLDDVIKTSPLLQRSPSLRKIEAKRKWAAKKGEAEAQETSIPRVKYSHKFERSTSLTVLVQEKPDYKKCDLFTELVSYYNDVEWDTGNYTGNMDWESEGRALSH
mmetsp:Transcript_5734/g.7904  ORF Transcript_5734/g.7904 Transcript_5734/m.7904 type:complete len:560 (+) Transcript_5734:61-1740(+)